MKKPQRIIAIGFVLAGLLIGFQNCSGGSAGSPDSGSSSSVNSIVCSAPSTSFPI